MEFLSKVSKRNANLLATRQITAAFLGDSVTHGCFETFMAGENRIDSVFDYENVYHARFAKLIHALFPAVPLNILNAGIGGDNAPSGLKRLERDVLACSPDLVVVCYGLNDVHRGAAQIGEYADAVTGIVQRLKKEKIETIFMTPNMMNTAISPHMSDGFLIEIAKKCAAMQNEGVLDAYIDRARSICGKEGVPVCDCYKKWKMLAHHGVNVTELLANHINHPVREMHALFAQSLLDTVLMA